MKKLRFLSILYMVGFCIFYSIYLIFHLHIPLFEEPSTLSIAIGALLFISVLFFIATTKKDR